MSSRYIDKIYSTVSGERSSDRKDYRKRTGGCEVLELAILGALKERPMHGYELKKRLAFLLGHFWKISFGSLYPALKRLESRNAIEKAYTVKEKTRNRYVYRITGAGEELFGRLLSDVHRSSEITDGEKFNLRLAFFQYLEPEKRLRLLEKRRNYLEERLGEMKRLGKGREKEPDSYRQGLFRHRQEMIKSDLEWINGLIEQERRLVEKGRRAKKKVERRDGKEVLEESMVEEATPLKA
jgi:DNA-binding PadR family transcriptional regulator